MSKILSKEIIAQLNNAYYNIDIDDRFVMNPFERLRTDDPNEFYTRLTYLLMQPEYFSFICKHIFNVEILPFQALILKEMWIRKFPMLIASRGASKSFMLSLYAMLRALLMPNRKVVIVGAAFRQSKFLFDYMTTIWRNAPVLRDLCDGDSGPRSQVDMCKMTLNGSTIVCLPVGDGCCTGDTLTTRDGGFYKITDRSDKIWGNGKFRDIEYNIDNGIKPTKIVTTKRGFSYEATYNHAMKVLRDGKIEWVRTDEMKIGDRILIDRSRRWHNGNFKCTLDQAYTLGAMIGDGCWTDKYSIRFATIDKEIIDRVNCGFENKLTQRKDKVHWSYSCQYNKSDWLNFWGLDDKCYTKNKQLPQNILNSDQSCMSACLSGLFDTDGHVFVDTSKGGTTISVNFTNTSEVLVKQLQYILLHYGIISTIKFRDRDEKWNRVYELGIYGKNVKLFAEQINFYLPRKKEKLNDAINQKKIWNSFGDSIPITYDQVLSVLNYKKVGCTPAQVKRKKSFQIQFLQKIIDSADTTPEWANLVSENIFYDEISSIENSECHTYDIHVPDGNEYCANGCFSHNSKIRGQRANDILADEFSSQSRDIFENVIAGFAAVSSNPVESVKNAAKSKMAKNHGYELESSDKKSTNNVSNQIILSGTAYYDFNHFADYWKRWKTILDTKGDPHKISQNVFNGESVPESFKWDDYSIIRLPVDLVPQGFMDEGTIARSKATVHNGIFLMEFSACFAKDSQGFFKRSLIESCVGTDLKPVQLQSGPVYFDPLLKGLPGKKYVIAIDPASEVDNFSIIIIELNADHRRIVYCWTTTRKQHIDKVAKGITKDNNFYSYCARKIRDLMDLFNVIHISMDSQGGGYAVSEALHDTSSLKNGELPIWPIVDSDDPKPSDNENGIHILELCSFSDYEWYSEANHGLRKDLETKAILFPRFDPITIGLSIEEDSANNRLYDTLEDCVMEIEELKTEMSLIEISASVNGRERWDTPEMKAGVNKKKRMRKDRYSALIMANIAGRRIDILEKPKVFHSYGGFSSRSEKSEKGAATFTGPKWFTNQMNGVYD